MTCFRRPELTFGKFSLRGKPITEENVHRPRRRTLESVHGPLAFSGASVREKQCKHDSLELKGDLIPI